VSNTEAIWQDFSARLRGYIGSRVGDADDAEDILQDVFYKIHSGIDGLDDSSRLAPWVYRIAQNRIVDYYRRRASRRTVDTEPGDAAAVPPEAGDEAPNLEAWMRGAIQELPDMYREAITLTEIDGLTQKELAERAGISLSGAKSRVQRGRAMIKDMLLACCHLEFDRRGNIVDYRRRDDCRYCRPGCDDEC
jgi:RNA polymerase sigma-70 factor (ECF subfamily)